MRDDVDGARLDGLIHAAEVFADDPEREQLHSAEKGDGDDNRWITRDKVVRIDEFHDNNTDRRLVG